MSTLEEARAAIACYHESYRNPRLPQFVESGLYDLCPNEACPSGVQVAERYPGDWPHGRRSGIYLVLDKSLSVLYVGKASQGERAHIGGRLSGHFLATDNTRAIAKNSRWDASRFVVAVAVGEAFEASSLEEYLIGALRAPYNVRT